jgi:hypothetical protein
MLSLAGVDVPRHVEGHPFLGSERAEREYVFASRDRYDESYDMVRAVRDRRYKYVRHYYPGRPYVQWIPYRNRHPAMRELLRLSAEDELTGAAARFMADSRPAEELYDLHADPHETDNLVDDPGHGDALDRLRSALDDWQDRTGDRGLEDEATTVERGWPGGEQPTTAAPIFVPNAPENRGAEPVEDATLSAPATLRIHCSTQGASIGYALDGNPDEETHWRLYDGPIRLPEGETTIRAKAIRYGYEESQVASATVRVS